jgi:hydrogenase-4 membrane subunit HyfE
MKLIKILLALFIIANIASLYAIAIGFFHPENEKAFVIMALMLSVPSFALITFPGADT